MNLTDPFRMLVVGGSGCGKTLVTANLLRRTDLPWSLANRRYVKMYLVLPGHNYDNPLARIPGMEVYEYSEEALEHIQKEASQMKGKKLLIFDDPATSVRHARQDSGTDSFWNMGRHFGFSTILIAQRFTQYPPAVRTNLTHILCFSLPNGRDLKSFCEEFTTLNLKQFQTLHNWYHKQKPHRFFILVNSNGWHIYDASFKEINGSI